MLISILISLFVLVILIWLFWDIAKSDQTTNKSFEYLSVTRPAINGRAIRKAINII